MFTKEFFAQASALGLVLGLILIALGFYANDPKLLHGGIGCLCFGFFGLVLIGFYRVYCRSKGRVS